MLAIHPFAPVYDRNSRILILGSMPSVKSRETGFYYGHPRNRFWKVTAAVMECPVPQSVEEKKRFLLVNGIALWDVVSSCEIKNSSDSSIRNVSVNDLGVIFSCADIYAGLSAYGGIDHRKQGCGNLNKGNASHIRCRSETREVAYDAPSPRRYGRFSVEPRRRERFAELFEHFKRLGGLAAVHWEQVDTEAF